MAQGQAARPQKRKVNELNAEVFGFFFLRLRAVAGGGVRNSEPQEARCVKKMQKEAKMRKKVQAVFFLKKPKLTDPLFQGQ